MSRTERKGRCPIMGTLKEFIEENNIVSVVRCGWCKFWRTGIAYTATGKCQCDEMPQGLITNKNFFCGYGRRKDG